MLDTIWRAGRLYTVPLHDVCVDEGRNDGDGDDLSPLLDELGDLLVLDAHHVLTVHLQRQTRI